MNTGRRAVPTNRYIDRGALLAGFARNVISVCPKCAGPVVVEGESKYALPYQPKNIRLTCRDCSFQRKPRDLAWLGPVVGQARARCQHCGYKWLRKELRGNAKASASLPCRVEVRCPSCQLASSLDVEWCPMRFGGVPIDPIVGLPLWLQTPCCGEILWAYNARHLGRLRDYISASLRERTIGTHASVFQRLPRWMTAAKNRDRVLQCIERLQLRLEDSNS